MGTIIVSNRQFSVVDPVKALRCLPTVLAKREHLTVSLSLGQMPCTCVTEAENSDLSWFLSADTLELLGFFLYPSPLSPFQHIQILHPSILQGVGQNQEVFPDHLHLRRWPFPPTLTAVTLSSWAGANFLRLFLVHLGCSPTVPPTCSVKPSKSTWNEWKNKMKLKDITAKVNREMIYS